MSYQIKSTPYFRRMFNNSKKNGQLQRLREEYERIQEFNDHTIELKMRQVRLKRLFREIEEIKESAGSSSVAAANAAKRAHGRGVGGSTSQAARQRRHQLHGHQHPHPHPHPHHHRLNRLAAGTTPEQRRFHQRADALIRSRELGKALSRRNAQMNEAGVSGYLSQIRNSSKMQAVADFRRDAQERRERAAKRISYGNDQSRQNLRRQLRVCQRRLTGKCQPQHSPESSCSHQVRPDYEHITPSQLDMMVDEEDLASEQQRYFQDQEEDELQEIEDRYREQEKRLRREARSFISSEEEDGQEELRFLRGEQTLSDDDENDENAMEQYRRSKHQEHLLGDHKYNLTLAEEHFRLEAYSDDAPQMDVSADKDNDEVSTPQQGDEEGTEEEPRRRRLCEKSSLLPLGRISLSSTAIGTAPSFLSHHHHHHHYEPYQPVSAALSSDQEMATAPLANDEQATSLVIPPSVKCGSVSETDDLPALNNWRRVSLMMPWFKVFTPPKSLSECSQSLSGTIQVPQQQLQEMGETPEPTEQSMN
ncbi:trichohyalin [Drosophila serrata]|uniref:trichohyalin n=1 Tax=Drosophila serrata TaxID=7274 RepID=UPI000A1D0192|nr:trichohyalin [Drosophila serrata]